MNIINILRQSFHSWAFSVIRETTAVTCRRQCQPGEGGRGLAVQEGGLSTLGSKKCNDSCSKWFLGILLNEINFIIVVKIMAMIIFIFFDNGNNMLIIMTSIVIVSSIFFEVSTLLPLEDWFILPYHGLRRGSFSYLILILVFIPFLLLHLRFHLPFSILAIDGGMDGWLEG